MSSPVVESPRLWQLWRNPIFRRYARSRLRPQALGVGIIVSLMLAGFIFFGARTLALYRSGMPIADAERVPLLPLLVLQAIMLFFLGTGQVAGGMTAEADEGVLDYQRLTPMSPLAKVLGYLFGLPIREYVMFACSLPFTIWGLWRGEVPFTSWASVYIVVFTSAVLYHLTGLVAGTVVKNRRWAFLVSIAIVFVLYTVMPQVSRFGLTTFKYLTIWPVIEENAADLVPREAGGFFRAMQRLMAEARFFNLTFSETIFTLFSQGGLIVTFVVMLWRRWRRSDAHLLGKLWAVGLMAWTQVMLLGNALPLIGPGQIFPSREFGRKFMTNRSWKPELTEGMVMIGLYGMVALGMLVTLTLIITPTLDGQVRGRRRARKLGLARPPWFSDAATAFWFVLAMAAAGTAGWSIFAHALMGSTWYAGYPLPDYAASTFALVLLGSGLCLHAILERWGGRQVFLAVVFIGVAPVMVGATLAAASNRLLTAALWLIGISPAAAPVFASQTLLPTFDVPLAAERAIPPAFWFWQGLTFAAAVWLSLGLWREKRARAAAEAAETGATSRASATPAEAVIPTGLAPGDGAPAGPGGSP